MATYLLKESDAIKTAWMILEGLGYSKEENADLQATVEKVFSTCPKAIRIYRTARERKDETEAPK